MGRIIIVFMFTFFSIVANAQEKACYDLTTCTDNGKAIRAEIVPQSQLAKCEDYKAKYKAVKGLIVAERDSLVSASACLGSLKFSNKYLIEQTAKTEEEHQKRIAAESSKFYYLGGGVIVGIIVGAFTVFLVQSSK